MTAVVEPRAPCEELAWDSAHFGLRIGRLTRARPTDDDLRRALAWCRGESIDCLYLLADAGDPTAIRRAEAAGFGLVDVRVTLERRLAADRGAIAGNGNREGEPSGGRGEPGSRRSEAGSAAAEPPAAVAVIRPALVPDDLPALGDLAAAAHRGTRFFNDPRFPEADCERLYRAWIESSARGGADAVLVVEAPPGNAAAGGRTGAAAAGGAIAGYVTCHLDGAAGSIGLLGVATAHRGTGLGGALVAAALDRLTAHGAERTEVVTQGANVAAQRLYQRAGFVTRSLGLWYHLWLDRAGDAAGRPAGESGGDAGP